eukprot:UN12416
MGSYLNVFSVELTIGLNVLKSFYRYVTVSLDFPLYSEHVFESLPDVFWTNFGTGKATFLYFCQMTKSRKNR